MSTKDLKQLMEERCQQIAEILNSHRDNTDPPALAVSKLDPLFQEILELQQQIFSEISEDE